MSKPLFYTGSKGAQNTTLVDMCLDYFCDANAPVSIGTVDEIPTPQPDTKVLNLSNVIKNTLFVQGSFSEVLHYINSLGRKGAVK